MARSKERTQRKLLDAALEMVEERSFSSLSLRELTRQVGIVPGAFYRHYRSVDDLGLALVEESFGTLRAMLRAARADQTPPEDMIKASVAILVRHVHEHRGHFRFITRELAGGTGPVRQAIRQELLLFRSELAVDLGRLPYVREWTTDDLYMLADLIVQTMVTTVQSLLDAEANKDEEASIITGAERKLRLIILGVPHWRSK